jgi:hypothetical protein
LKNNDITHYMHHFIISIKPLEQQQKRKNEYTK